MVTAMGLVLIGFATSFVLEHLIWRRIPGSLRLQVHPAARHTGHLKLVRRSHG